ncbi:hypothetical protein GCM10012276_24700 [Nocardioides deserti]|nr:hypothetical protein GCM10012276_24700 [Nocardioides deserti]
MTKPYHLTDALASLDINLTDDEISERESGYESHVIAGHR